MRSNLIKRSETQARTICHREQKFFLACGIVVSPGERLIGMGSNSGWEDERRNESLLTLTARSYPDQTRKRNEIHDKQRQYKHR